ncbi:low molecular weight protein-tyrosine-phosphatase [Vibrio alfacsensis]|uniref:low molecular weight protein-tyrosine-phosphatase n=1 Tax=Vibrio alfacsensis TaxID=1074311 RepID=UPI002ADE6609|nr:low molecular weight protein-tyrosine-phosphatase [Vibrio alfacsensis]WQE78089.1 low molecular weight protein-tyrosine-phosphatase [Vibrio alfacsensis]
MFNRILVVCTGNICRSPIAEALLKSALPSHVIESAGIHVLNNKLTDASAHQYSQEVCIEHGFNLSHHSARQLNSNLCDQFDLILVMSHEQIEEVASISPRSRGKTMLFGHWIGQGEIQDPLNRSKSAFNALFLTLQSATNSWKRRLLSQ